MPRPRKTRFIQGDTTVRYYKPQGIPLEGLIETDLSLDGLEALRLADAEGLEQDAAAQRMGISRSTFSRLLGEARGAVATALTRGWAIRIDGGPVTVVPEVESETPYGRRRAHCVRRAAAAAITEQLHQKAALENSQVASMGSHEASRASSGS